MAAYDKEIQSMYYVAHISHSSYEHLIPQDFWNTPVFLPYESFKRLSVNTDTCLIINDASADPVGGRTVCDILGMYDICYIVLKVDIGKEIPGHIVVASRGLDLYTQKHAHLLLILRDPFSIAMANAIKHEEVVRLKDLLNEDNKYLFSKLHKKNQDSIIGKDKGLKEVMDTVMEVARLNSVVMLLGETGVGKELIANAIHYNSSQANGPFVKINCGAIPDNLIDSELFGYEKGAFTGAVTSKRGHFERAHNGTLFLDEIGDLPLSAQVRLLRVLQQKELIRVGGTQSIKTNVRIITATHHDLEHMVKKGNFRKDLWFRINVFPITIPPLRERMADILDLTAYFIQRKSQEMNLKQRPQLSPKAIKNLMAYHWPGNIRELENCVERELIQKVVVRHNAVLDFERIENSLESVKFQRTQIKSYPLFAEPTYMTCDEITRNHFQEVLNHTKGRIQGPYGAAAILGLEPNTLRYRLKRLGISYGRKCHSM